MKRIGGIMLLICIMLMGSLFFSYADEMTGIFDGQYWYKGKVSTVTGVRYETLLKDGKVVTGLSGKVVTGGYIYQVEETGAARLVIGAMETEAACTVSGKEYMYRVDTATGKAEKLTGILDGQYWYRGAVSTVTGVRCETLLRNGKVVTGISGKVVTGGYIYSVKKDGSARLFLRDGKGMYFRTARTVTGSWYMYKACCQTGEAEKAITQGHSDTYVVTSNGRAYEVFCSTAEYITYSGYHLGRYYENGEIVSSERTTYRVSGKYAYKVSTNGYARKYVRNRDGKGTFKLKYNGYVYEISESTGKITEESQKLADFLKCARGYLGYSEKDNSFREIIDIYNGQKVLPRNYRMKYSDEWCAAFVSAVAMKSGNRNAIPMECSCYYQMRKWMKIGRWIENDAYVPAPGDIIYYDWNDSGKGDCRGFPDHVGIVESVANGKITVIEGNRREIVSRRVIAVNGRYIRGFARPAF